MKTPNLKNVYEYDSIILEYDVEMNSIYRTEKNAKCSSTKFLLVET